MNPGELARPITIYWDLTPKASPTPEYLRICEQIATARPLQLHLLDCGPTLTDSCVSILGYFKGAPPAVALTAEAGALSPAVLDLLQELGLRGLLIRSASYAGLTDVLKVRTTVDNRFSTALSFVVTRENWRDLPRVLACCLEHGISSLTLPMQRLYSGEQAFLLNGAEQSELAALLAAINYTSLRLTIHDPFLWRAFHPAAPFPGGGCQAANTMLAISPDGTVYPCPSLPIPLGNLQMTTLPEILAATAKQDLRNKLQQAPAACAACDEADSCVGGCRGRIYSMTGSLSGIDPACTHS